MVGTSCVTPWVTQLPGVSVSYSADWGCPRSDSWKQGPRQAFMGLFIKRSGKQDGVATEARQKSGS